ncbi:MAG: adenosylmethionine--8-amino-7-oxononanoate aminotransferase BioA [Proteobacteria bacterium SG_bin5]|nr:adenosylmethionine--8-amino-7-oxononanoate transaminase [Sphingomonas sp.]MBX9814613.1 adenosylmethionine--8-amino-7-oxononanoate transaminase [Sphingomonas sp.]OQW39638.1 MAG: adenosylmethionine--8-amino-7-oxononanoate aminotransferase BioA [Proteobacteria bacterium SG_bin5]
MSAVWHPFFQHALEPAPLKIARTEGAWLETDQGARLLDAISSWWVVTHGHRHPAIMTAIRAASEALDQVIFAGFTHEPAEALAAELAGLAGLPHVFFSDSGSTAVEVALKMALGTARNRGERRERLVVMAHSYHGDTVGAMSVGARGVFNAPYAPLLFDVATIPFPAPGAEQACFDALAAATRDGRAAAFIVEPLVLGAGGMLMYPPAVLAELHRSCRASGTLFIADEVMTGWGRTGTLFACAQAGIVPDLLCLSKGLTNGSLPLAATLARAEIFEAHYSQNRARTFWHSSSYSGNPIACAAGLANVRVWREEPVAERVAALAAAQARQLARLAGDDRFADLRQTGTITAMTIPGPEQGYLAEIGCDLRAAALARGVLLRPMGDCLYVLPPYCISEAELARVYDVILEIVPRR